ncbi:hypothetical protein IWQ56_000560 [Coemansia nantahalensis]|nr:hypothetical protein IWQ56_000560 [Coemansia nantahalensis]
MRVHWAVGLGVAAAASGVDVLRSVGEPGRSGVRHLAVADGDLAERVAHWGRLAAATYQRFEEWEACEACQHPDISGTEVAATWSTAVPAFSRGFVGVDHRRRQVAVVFRGTTHVMDVVTDVQAALVPWPEDGALVHAGFLRAYQAARPAVAAALDAAQQNASLAGYSLHFVGHSLGGAQATLAYVDYRRQQQTHQHSRRFPAHRQLVSFGSPQVGNRRFAQLLAAPRASHGVAEDSVLRVVHEADIVPHLPGALLMNYAHGGREIWARDTDGAEAARLTVCQLTDDGHADPACSASLSPLRWSIIDHMVYPGMRLGIPQF